MDSKLAQGFYTWSALRESNTRPLDPGSNALTTPPRAPHIQRLICLATRADDTKEERETERDRERERERERETEREKVSVCVCVWLGGVESVIIRLSSYVNT